MAHEDTAREILDLHITDTPNGYVVDYYEAIGAITSALQAAAAEATERALGESLRDRAADELSPQERSSPFGSASLSQAERDAAYFQDINVKLEAALRGKEAVALRLRSERNQLRCVVARLMEWDWDYPFERDDYRAIMMDAYLMDREDYYVLLGQAKKIASVEPQEWALQSVDQMELSQRHFASASERDRNPQGGDFLGSVER